MSGLVAAAAFLAVFQLCGICAARLVLPRESGGVKLLIGSVFGSVLMQWLPVGFAFFCGFTVFGHVCAAAVAVIIAAACLAMCKRYSRAGLREAFSAFGRKKFLFAIAAVTAFFCFLVWKSFLFADGRIYSSQATYGDMSMHLGFITSLAEQQSFPPEYSILPGFRLSYPFLSDSISASLYLLGVSLKWAYFLPMALAGAQVFFGFYCFAARLLEGAKKAALAWVLFFFNGGIGFVYFFTGEKSLSDLLNGFYQTPTNLVEKNIRWVNVIVDMMLPQRATLFGWAVLFSLLYLLYRAAFEEQRRYFAVAGVLAGLLPMIHTHSFLAAALVCGAWLMCSLLRESGCERVALFAVKLTVAAWVIFMTMLCGRSAAADSDAYLWAACGIAAVFIALLVCLAVKNHRWRELFATWGVMFAVACALALPQLFYWTFRQVGENDMLRGHLCWVITDGADGYLEFYFKNIGVAAVLALGGLLTANGKSLAKFSPAVAIWILAELVEFQPNNYDNNKLLYAAYAFLCCAAAEFLCGQVKRLKSRGMRELTVTAVMTVCVTSSVMTMAREVAAKYELFGTGAIALCEFVEENTAADSVILTDTRHNNEIAALSGRNIVCGSSSYLYFHGLPYYKYEQAAREIYEYPNESENWIAELGVDYILVSDFERSSYQVDENAIAARYPKIYDDGVRVLYQVTKGGNA